MTHYAPNSRLTIGLGFAMISAASFGVSGSLAKGLLVNGWTAGAAVLLRVTIAAIVLAIPGYLAMRGRHRALFHDPRQLRKAAGAVLGYGVFAVAGAQLFYFMAVSTLDVGIAMLIEYLAPVAVVLWMWARHGSKPTRLTGVGAGVAAVGLVLLLNVIGGGDIDIRGVGWALAAMVGATVYFIVSSDDSNPLPPMTLAAAGLAVAAVVLGLAAAIGIIPLAFSNAPVVFVPITVPAWLVIVVLGVVTAAIAYVAGIAAVRRLGARLGSFVALSEVLAATVFAWILLGQVPAPVQILGAGLVLAGVVVVKLGEPKHAQQELLVEPLPIGDALGAPEPVAR